MAATLVSRAESTWTGDRASGLGSATLASIGLGRFDVDWRARTRGHDGWTTSPEELLAAAHATCYSMQLADELARMGRPPSRLETSAEVGFHPTRGITGIHLSVRAWADDIPAAAFRRAVGVASHLSPLTRALAGVATTVTATLTATRGHDSVVGQPTATTVGDGLVLAHEVAR